MTDLWQVTFTVDDHPEMIAEMVEAGLDAEGISIHRDDDNDPWFVMIITTSSPDEDRLNMSLADACNLFGVAPVRAGVTMLPSRDWLAENRKSFPPLDIGSFWIYGAYVDAPVPEGKIGLKIDAGQAFGSGTHATTYGCIMMLEKHCPDHAKLKIADIGCGSGILAMAAAKIRPDADIIAVDNDPIAVETTRDNAADNGVGDIIRFNVSDGYNAPIVQDNAPYDVILANILPGPLVEMAPDAVKCLAHDGLIILSGLLEDQQDQVADAYIAQGLKRRDHMIHNEWACLVMEFDHG